jgi:hypothetical protein
MVLGYDYFELCSSFTRKERSSYREECMLKMQARLYSEENDSE